MKEVTVEQLASQPAEWLDAAQRDRVVVTKDGKPSALIVGIENQDEEDWDLQLSPEFWRMIEERRREPTIPWEQVKAELLKDE
jgi:prevent-host-death family protein